MKGLKDIPGYEGVYRVSKSGDVYSVNYNKSNGLRKRKPYVNWNGYLQIVLCKNGVIETTSIHRIVAITFIKNPKNLPCVNHKNGIKTDNRLGNLEWCTFSYNNTHAYRSLNRARKNIPVNQYTRDGVFIRSYGSRKEAAEVVGVNQRNICNAASGKIKHSAGFIWKNESCKKPRDK